MAFAIDEFLQQGLYHSLVTDKLIGIYCIKLDGSFLYANNRFCELFEYGKDEIKQTNFFKLIDPDDISVVREHIGKRRYEAAPNSRYQIRGLKKNQTIIHLDVLGHFFQEDEGVSWILGMMLEQNEVDTTKTFQKLNDSLTGLPNRKLFDEEFQKKLEEAKANQFELALMFLDLDGFKFINETLGHEIGDRLLREVAHRLNQSRRVTDSISRFGGDEFTILVTNLKTKDEIHNIAKKYLSLFERPFVVDHYELYLTTSIGISLYPSSGEKMDVLIQNADLALYRAKDEGKNKYEIYSPMMNIGKYKKFTLKNGLRKAIQENELFLKYQPKVDCNSNKIVGVEALARWEHPEWGLVGPDEFIFLAEQSGLINMIGEQILFEACRQNKKWQDEGYPPIKIAVNFSPLQFLHSEMIDIVDHVLTKTGLDPKWLEIEITETVIMKNEASTLLILEQLRDRNISITVDDFGTGFSSLSYLKKIKPETIKIDKSFIQGIPEDLENTEIVKALIKLAQRLKIKVIAEGVDHIDQVSFLRKINCNELQGYLYSKPVEVDDFTKLLEKGLCAPEAAIEKEDLPFETRCEYFRINLTSPLVADMTILLVNGKVEVVDKTTVLIEDIGPGGIRFTSNRQLPKKTDIALKFSTWILGENIEFTGAIVWEKEVNKLHQYGLKFIITDMERESLISLFGKFQVKIHNNLASSTTSFLKTSRSKFFQA